MQKILDKLHRDHINFTKLLKFFELQLDNIRCGIRADYALLQNALDYLSEYQDTIHHPIENDIYAAYLKRHGDSKDVIDGLTLEHTSLKFLTSKLGEIIQYIVQGDLDDIRGMERQLYEFVERQKNHIDFEEDTIFKIMDQALKIDDWKRLEIQFLPMDDPLFGQPTQQRYRELLAFIRNIN